MAGLPRRRRTSRSRSRPLCQPSIKILVQTNADNVVTINCPYDYEYLGCIIDYKISPAKEIKRRAARAYATAAALQQRFFFSNNTVKPSTKRAVGSALLCSQAFYAAQCWLPLNKGTQSTLKGATKKNYRAMYGNRKTSWQISDDTIAADLGVLQRSHILFCNDSSMSKGRITMGPTY